MTGGAGDGGAGDGGRFVIKCVELPNGGFEGEKGLQLRPHGQRNLFLSEGSFEIRAL